VQCLFHIHIIILYLLRAEYYYYLLYFRLILSLSSNFTTYFREIMLVLSVQFIFIHVSSSLYITTFYSISVFSIFCFLGTGMMLTARFMRWSTRVQSVLSSRLQPHTRPKVSIPRRQAVHFLRRLVTCLSARRTGFAPGSVHVGFVVDEVVFLRVLRFFRGIIIPPCLPILISSGGWTTVPLVAAVQRESHPIDTNNNKPIRR
jgi:hypothetical protein